MRRKMQPGKFIQLYLFGKTKLKLGLQPSKPVESGVLQIVLCTVFIKSIQYLDGMGNTCPVGAMCLNNVLIYDV